MKALAIHLGTLYKSAPLSLLQLDLSRLGVNLQDTPALRNPRHEAFCQAFVTSGNASAAYRESGGKGKDANVMADQLMATNGIAERIAELKAAQAQKSELSRDFSSR